jgi:glutaredoxin-related protein
MLIGKEKCNQCNILKNQLDEKGIQYHDVDMLEMAHKNMSYLKIYCSSHPMVLNVKCFNIFNETLEHFNFNPCVAGNLIPASQEDFFLSFSFKNSLKVILKLVHISLSLL